MLPDFYTKGDAEEARVRFPANIGELFKPCRLQLVRLNARYKVYAELYGEQDAIDILEEPLCAASPP